MTTKGANMTDLTSQDASALAQQISVGTLSAAELMAATLQKIDAVNPELNAVVSLRPAGALMDEARAADAADTRGPLHGLPLVVKDLANAAGLPTSRGSPLFAGQIAPKDDIHIARLRAAGAIVIGKSNVPEFGLGSHSVNPVFGVTRNPYDPSVTAGGSSGGAAVALATGMAALADGSDMMGSLRNPAGWCGIYSLRPSYGLVPDEPLGDTFLHQLATNGPMGRSPADVALMLSVMAGPDPRQPNDGGSFANAPLRPAQISGMRIGWLADWGGAYPMEDGVLAQCRTGLERFEEMGAVVETVAPPFSAKRLWRSWNDLRAWAVAAGYGPLLAMPESRKFIKEEAIWEAEKGAALSALDIHAASTIRSDWFAKASALLQEYDALVLPTAQCWPFPVGWSWPHEIAGQKMDSYHRWMEAMIPVSLIGLPAVTLPAGLGAAGLPMGLQMFGPRGADARLLQMAQSYHSHATA